MGTKTGKHRAAGTEVSANDLKQAEIALRIRDAAIAASINAVAFSDTNGTLTYVNPSFLKMWGYAEEGDVLGRSAASFWHTPEKIREVKDALRHDGCWSGEMVAVRGDGTLARNGSGGTIANTTGDAIALTNANNVTIQSMNLTSNGSNPATAADAAGLAGNHTIQVSGGSNLVLSGVYIQGSRGTGLLALNLAGTNQLNNNTRFEDTLAGAGHSVYVNNTNTNMTLFELNSRGEGNLSVPGLEPGFHVIRGCFSGGPGFAPSEDVATVVVRD